MNSSKTYYDRIAPSYVAVSAKRAGFLRGVNDFIVARAPRNCSYLDVGAGNGSRSKVISEGVSASKTTLLDESGRLLAQHPPGLHAHVVCKSIVEVNLGAAFDLITCLWNVLGHVGDRSARQAAIQGISNHLAVGGMAFIDVNNRYNVSEYGIDNVMRNVEADIRNEPRRGWFTIAEGTIATEVYLHDPFELDEMFENACLSVIQKVFIDYTSGEVVPEYWRGQILYQLQKSIRSN